MRIKDRFIIAIRNLGANKRMVIKMIVGMMFIVLILICSLTIVNSFFAYTKEFNHRNAPDCYYYSNIESQEISEKSISNIINNSIKMQNKYNADDVLIFCNLQSDDLSKEFNAQNINFIIDEKNYSAKNYTTNRIKAYQNINVGRSSIDLNLYDSRFQVVPKTISVGKEDEYLLGEYPKNQGEILLDTYILNAYGIENIDEDLIGSRISISYSDDNNDEVILENYVLSGILDEDIISKRESIYAFDSHMEHIYVNLRDEDEGEFNIYYGSVRYYFDNYQDYADNYESMENFIKLNIDEVYSENAGIHLTERGMEYCLINWFLKNIGRLLLLVAVVIGIIVTFSILYIFTFYRDRNAKYFSMLQNIGMEKRDRLWIFNIEIFFIMLIATLVGIYFSVIFLMPLNFITSQVVNFKIVMDIKIGLLAIVASWVYFGICIKIIGLGKENA